MPTILLPYPSQSYDSEHFARLNVGSIALAGTTSDLLSLALSRLNDDGGRTLFLLAGTVVVGQDRLLP
jgi:hypothetical protein